MYRQSKIARLSENFVTEFKIACDLSVNPNIPRNRFIPSRSLVSAFAIASLTVLSFFLAACGLPSPISSLSTPVVTPITQTVVSLGSTELRFFENFGVDIYYKFYDGSAQSSAQSAYNSDFSLWNTATTSVSNLVSQTRYTAISRGGNSTQYSPMFPIAISSADNSWSFQLTLAYPPGALVSDTSDNPNNGTMSFFRNVLDPSASSGNVYKDFTYTKLELDGTQHDTDLSQFGAVIPSSVYVGLIAVMYAQTADLDFQPFYSPAVQVGLFPIQ